MHYIQCSNKGISFGFFVVYFNLQFVQLEAIISGMVDEYPKFRAVQHWVTLATCFFMWIVSNVFITRGGMYWLQLFDWYAASISVILICLVEIVIVGWIYGVHNFIRDVEFMIGHKVGIWWMLTWKYITPTILSVMKKKTESPTAIDVTFSKLKLSSSFSVHFHHNDLLQH